jgi:hypothetical protein
MTAVSHSGTLAEPRAMTLACSKKGTTSVTARAVGADLQLDNEFERF